MKGGTSGLVPGAICVTEANGMTGYVFRFEGFDDPRAIPPVAKVRQVKPDGSMDLDRSPTFIGADRLRVIYVPPEPIASVEPMSTEGKLRNMLWGSAEPITLKANNPLAQLLSDLPPGSFVTLTVETVNPEKKP